MTVTESAMALRSVSAVTFTSPERGGQADVPDEGSQGIDAPEGKGVIVHVPALNAPDADSEADEFRETVLINAPVIGRMEHCEAGAVIAVHVRAYLMLHHVTHEVRLLAELYYAVLGHGGVPHEVASGRVILFVTEGRPQIADDAAHERLADVVGHVVRVRRTEVDFHQVGERVKSAGHHLEARHAEGVRRIEEREAGVAFGVIAAGLHMKILIGDDGAAVALAARSQDGDHNAERQGGKAPEGALLRPEIVPDIAVVSRGYGNGLAAVHDRSAAHSDNEPHIFFPGQSRSFEHLLIGGGGHDA